MKNEDGFSTRSFHYNDLDDHTTGRDDRKAPNKIWRRERKLRKREWKPKSLMFPGRT